MEFILKEKYENNFVAIEVISKINQLPPAYQQDIVNSLFIQSKLKEEPSTIENQIKLLSSDEKKKLIKFILDEL